MRNLYNRESSNHLSSTAKKKIKHFSYHPEDKIGKGYSSVVFKGVNELSSTSPSTQMRPSRLRLSI
jgi:hypothetical protein